MASELEAFRRRVLVLLNEQGWGAFYDPDDDATIIVYDPACDHEVSITLGYV